jgi:hypothetical protein
MARHRQGWSIVVGFLLAGMVLGVCVACDDDDEDAWAPPVELADRSDRSDGKDSDGKCQGARYCQDDDFSPSFEDSPVYLCLPGSTCHFGEEKA